MSLPRKWAESYVAAVYMMVVGLALVGVGVWFTVDNVVFLCKAGRVPGTVVSVEKVRGAKGTPLYYPIVRYQDVEMGEPVIFKSRPGLWPSPFAVGDELTVACVPHNPANARVVSFSTLWFLPTCVILLGTGSSIAGLSTMTKRRREQT